MELNPRQQKLAFAVIVVILAGLGVYLLLPDTTPPRAAAPGATASATPTAPGAAATAPQPVATATPQASSAVNIYQWLPFSQNDLASAASAAAQAAGYYNTFSYAESASAYGSRMSNVVTSQYLQVLESDYSTYGVAKQRTNDKEISTASAVVNSLRSFGSSSLTFVVTISQHIQQASGTSTPTGQYAITVVDTGGDWQVDQIQLASAGNQ
ncbi:MAG TPA: hypothetical protein VLW50_25605 [Streptosporangiaceae bacterium]|nr:hypothetical protein [Streptosporangiaceae bacterium]